MMRRPAEPTAVRRANGPVVVYRLGEEPGDDLSNTTTPEGRIALVWELTRRMWALTGRPLPDPTREGRPIRVIRGLPDFEAAWSQRTVHAVRDRQVPFLGRAELIVNLRASGRRKPLAYLEALGELPPLPQPTSRVGGIRKVMRE
jgi:hypothetical protein